MFSLNHEDITREIKNKPGSRIGGSSVTDIRHADNTVEETAKITEAYGNYQIIKESEKQGHALSSKKRETNEQTTSEDPALTLCSRTRHNLETSACTWAVE